MGQSQCCTSETEEPFKEDPRADANILDAPVDAPKFTSGPESLAGDSCKWDVEEVGDEEEPTSFTRAQDNIGDHICPVTGEKSARHFLNCGVLQKLLDASKEDLGRNFSLDKDSFGDTKEGVGGIAMAVSDPSAEDCPLVFVSNGFEDLTGYTANSVVGRSCRFLQPTSKVLNDAVNLNERKLMRYFCNTDQAVGETIVNLLLNERNTGERFWNLLRMQYVSVDGAKYIFAVQTTVDAFMPKVLARRANDPSKNQRIASSIVEFVDVLERLRAEIRQQKFVPILELKGYYTCAVNSLEKLPMFQKQKFHRSTSADFQHESAPRLDEIRPGSTVMAINAIKYSSYNVVSQASGNVINIDSFGNAVIEWKDVGKRMVLKRDFDKLKVTATDLENQLRLVEVKSHPNWIHLAEMLKDPRGSDKASGIASSHNLQARKEIVQQLVFNHRAVIADVTNPSPKLSIKAKTLTQTELRRVPFGSRRYVDQMLREVARRLLGRRAGVEQLEEKPDRWNVVQVQAWRGCADYLAARTQYKPEDVKRTRGRKADMSEHAAAAFLAVLEEVASDAEEHPGWAQLESFLKKPPSSSAKAGGISLAHSQAARNEAARKLIRNHKAVATDVTNPYATLNIEGKLFTQTELKRLNVESRPYVDQMLREVARRLLGQPNPVFREHRFQLTSLAQIQAWRDCATYLVARTQSTLAQISGRKLDMSEAAVAAFLGVVEEVASEAEKSKHL